MLKKLTLLFLISSISLLLHAKNVNVKDYGAVGDGKTMNTAFLQKAIDECNASGGGKVIFPEGTYLSGTIVMKDNVTLRFEKGSRLLGSIHLADYRNLDPFTEGLGIDVGWALLVAVDLKNIGIEGEGAIDGAARRGQRSDSRREARGLPVVVRWQDVQELAGPCEEEPARRRVGHRRWHSQDGSEASHRRGSADRA